jgi:hypothetical protein
VPSSTVLALTFLQLIPGICAGAISGRKKKTRGEKRKTDLRDCRQKAD